ncbi:AfsR/SARP family transcriptional regulator [Ornithinimicrobium sp. W1679]|uniref:AfsR/SARP family transcriptional regulator n=1 Tax=unclassified Ornithinimicrobium TaxID=2615080 RepID=UPI003CEE05A9
MAGRTTRVRLFGPTSVVGAGSPERAVHLVGKHGRILALLALELGHPVPKDRLAELVWDGRPPPSYRQALDSDVCVLRRKAELGPGRTSALATTPSGYVLDADRVGVDLTEARAHVGRACRERAALALADADAALALSDRGRLLEDEPYAAWAEQARVGWSVCATRLHVCASRAALAVGDPDRGVRHATEAVTHDPVSETAVAQLMRALWWDGRRAEAVHAYSCLRRRMLDDLGEEPGPATEQLFLTILRDEGGPRAAADPTTQIQLALRLLRETLDRTPGTRPPELDAELSLAAAAALTGERRPGPAPVR